MSVRQYIGARYVTKIYQNSLDPSSAEWEQGTFEPLVMVTWQNSTYLSKKQVPGSVGDPANNPGYWVCTGYYNGQIMQIQNELAEIKPITGNMITPQDYGAVGDGVTNDTTALQAALQACVDNKKILYIPEGTYLFNDTLQITNVSIYGLNAVLKYTGSSTAIEILNGYNTILYGFTLTTATGDIGIKADGHLTFSLLDHLYIYGFNTAGVYFTNAYLCKITDVIVENCTHYGFYLSDAYNSRFHAITAIKCDINIYLESGSSVHMSDVNCSGAHTYGMQLDYVFAGVLENIYYEDQSGYEATNAIYAGPSGVQNTVIRGLFCSMVTAGASYIRFDGSSGAYNRYNTLGGIVISSNDSTQYLIECTDYSGYPRVFNNILEALPTETNSSINLLKGDGSISVLAYNDGQRHDFTVANDIVTDRGLCARFASIAITSDGSGYWTLPFPAGVSADKISIVEFRTTANTIETPTNVQYYSTDVGGAGLTPNTDFNVKIVYTI